MSHSHDPTVPKSLLFAAGGMILLTFAMIGWSQMTREETVSAVPVDNVVASRMLRFVDQPDGSVTVLSDPRGDKVGELEKGEDNFVRGVLRGLVRERRLRSIGDDMPFHLVLHGNNTLSLIDPATGTQIELRAFGVTNVQAFARFLEPRGKENQNGV